MKLNANAFGLATASAVAIAWLACSLVVLLMPGMSMNMSAYMMHADFTDMHWSLNITGFLLGLVLWSLLSGVLAWLVALIYNKLVNKSG